MPSLTDLIAQLPRPQSLPPLAQGGHGVRYVTTENKRFVVPDLLEVEAVKPGETSVVLLSAPAAVGKSTVANYVGFVTGAPVWDLAGKQVGTGSLTGTLVNAYESNHAPEVFEKLRNGELFVVLDALDETQLLSGAPNFEEFLKDVLQYCQKPLPNPCLLLLARADTSVIIEVALVEHSVNYAHYQIDFFDRLRAREFIARSLSVRGKKGSPWEKAADALFAFVCELLDAKDDPWDDAGVRAFLGYAPVLEAMVEYLDHPNPAQLVSQLEQARKDLRYAGQAGSWKFLLDLIGDLLQRESDKKVVPAVKGRLAASAAKVGWNKWGDLYTEQEQCQRVLAQRLGVKLPAALPPDLPVQLRPEYEKAIEASLPNHPFLGEIGGFANVVFREYLYARELSYGGPLVAHVRRHLQRPGYLPTPLLGRFVLSLSPRQDDEALVHRSDVGFICESLTSQAKTEGEVHFGMWSDLEEKTIRAAVYGATLGIKREKLAFRVRPEAATLSFPRRLTHAEIRVTADVDLGIPGRAFALGPAVHLECATFRCLASELLVRTAVDEDVEVLAEAYGSWQETPFLRHYDGGTFGVQWRELSYPWVDYSLRVPEPPPEAGEDFLLLRRVLGRFRASGYQELARHHDIIDYIVVGQSPRGRALLEFLKKKGLISRRGPLYILSRLKLDGFGINYDDVRQNKLNMQVVNLLREFEDWAR